MDVVRQKLNSEICAARMAGPFKSPPFDKFFLSPLKLIPKKQSEEFRLLLNLSYPFYNDMSVNSGIDSCYSRVTYEDLDHAINIVQEVGMICYIAKSDLCHAFKLLPIHPSCYWMMGFTFEGRYYYDKTMVMGASSSCSDFEKLSTALQWILVNKLGVTHMSHILDDFMFFAPSLDLCTKFQKKFEYLCADLGLPIKHSKTVTPSTQVELHGVLVDTVARSVSLPADKCVKATDMLLSMYQKQSVTLKSIQSCIGFLNFACRCIDMARPFLRRLIDLTKNVSRTHHHVSLTREARKDMDTWLLMLQHFNGKALMKDPYWTASNSIRLWSDASGLGFAVIFGSKWAFGRWPPLWDNYHITVKEMYPIALAMQLWGNKFANHRILFMTDNEAVAYCLRKQTSKDPLVMRLIRWMVATAIRHNVCFSAKHIPGHTNVIADLLSRLSVPQAQAMAPWLASTPEEIPACHLPWTIQ